MFGSGSLYSVLFCNKAFNAYHSVLFYNKAFKAYYSILFCNKERAYYILYLLGELGTEILNELVTVLKFNRNVKYFSC